MTVAEKSVTVVLVGDTVEIHAQGVIRKGVVTYADFDRNGGYWLIEGKDPVAGCFYWKQRHDGGVLVSVTSKAAAVAHEDAEAAPVADSAPGVELPRTDTQQIKNGTYTLVSGKSGEHRTFKISTVQSETSGLHGKRIMSLLTGPNNEADYTGFAFVNDDNTLKVWGRFYNTLTESMGKCLMNFLIRGTVDADGAVRLAGVNGHVLFKSACRVCNRPLTCPESIRTGIGPICAGR